MKKLKFLGTAPFPDPDWEEEDWMTLTSDGEFEVVEQDHEDGSIYTVASGSYTVKNDILTLSGYDEYTGETQSKVCHIVKLTKDNMILRIGEKAEDGEYKYVENWIRIK